MARKPITLPSLFLELERWTLDKLASVPPTAPVALQLTESIFAVRARVVEILRWEQPPTSEDAILAAFCDAVAGRFTSQAQPLARLVRAGKLRTVPGNGWLDGGLEPTGPNA